MRLYATQGLRGTVIDLDTNRAVPKPIWVDQEAGELEAYQVDAGGNIRADVNGDYLTQRLKGRFKFVPRQEPSAAKRVVMGAPTCARCHSQLTLPGNDLCFRCHADDKGIKRQRVDRLTGPLFDRPCEKCRRRWAEYEVSDEAAATPLLYGKVTGGLARIGSKILWGRAATVARHWYCAFCYQPPRLVDARGEVIEEFAEAGGVRPQ
jgi:hypothetical protein